MEAKERQKEMMRNWLKETINKGSEKEKETNNDEDAVPPIRSEFSDFGPNSDFFEPNSPNLV